MKFSLFLSLFALLFVSQSCNLMNCKSGKGELVEEERRVEDFEQVAFSGSGDLNIRSGNTRVRVEDHESLIGELETEVGGGTLKIDYDGCVNNSNLRADLSTRRLSGVYLSGSTQVDVAGNYDSSSFAAVISGSADMRVHLEQSLATLSATVSGSGTVDARDSRAERVEVNISGSGNVIVYAERELEVNISGSGDVVYYGNPRITQKVSGSGSIRSGN